MALAEKRRVVEPVGDIEDVCTLCAPFEEAVEGEDAEELEETKKKPTTGEGKLSRFFAGTPAARTPGPDARTLETIVKHARKFPLKKPKKKVREEETFVCAIRRASDGRYLIHQRPDKGLLGGLWELPSHTLPETNDSTAKTREADSLAYAAEFIPKKGKGAKSGHSSLKHVGELGSVPWLFSHLKLTMHVHLFELDDAGDLPEVGARERWACVDDVDSESMGTGMKKCWALVKETTA
jgi:A/G-specific adenine glycosylase